MSRSIGDSKLLEKKNSSLGEMVERERTGRYRRVNVEALGQGRGHSKQFSNSERRALQKTQIVDVCSARSRS
ncbi:unnamed protein product [Oikopleura dioica]|uniref:Uncharacterized protein n=1 Tax=Oikopleura dioica TaxID=34765 RepID=E4YSZ8_OIKDI|nr:unnamed protein product [Oikopleura dioica]